MNRNIVFTLTAKSNNNNKRYYDVIRACLALYVVGSKINRTNASSPRIRGKSIKLELFRLIRNRTQNLPIFKYQISCAKLWESTEIFYYQYVHATTKYIVLTFTYKYGYHLILITRAWVAAIIACLNIFIYHTF